MSQKSYSVFVKSLLLIVFITGSQLLSNTADAQVTWSSSNTTQWMVGSDWTGSVVPTSTQYAEFDATPASGATIGIDMSGLSGATNNGTANQAVGAIYSSGTRTNAITINNSSTTTTGTLTLKGATVNSVSNVVLEDIATGQHNMTITNGTGSGTMNVAIGNSAPVIIAGVGTTSGLGNTIDIVSNISSVTGSTPITFLGSGTYDPVLNSTGLNGGTLELGGANTFSGGVIVGTGTSGSPTYNNSGTLQLDVTNAIPNIAGNNITVNNNSELLINSTATGAFTTNNITLTLNGLGNNDNSGALRVKTAAGSWNGPVNLATTAMITITSATTNVFNISGNISGVGQLQKQGGGTLELSGTGNSWAGGTLIGNANVQVDAGSSLSTAGLTMYQTSTNATALFLNNTSQTLDSLSSHFTATTGNIAQIITLGTGHTLTVNQTVNTSYGVGPASGLTSTIVGPGAIVKSGTGNLTLTGGGNTFSGGLTITAGTLTFSPPAGIYATTSSATGTSAVTLSGGTLSTTGIGANSGNPIYFGQLTLTGNATINLDATNQHSIQFADSHTATWTSGKTLTITNWTGGASGGSMSGTVGQIFAGTSAAGLTSAQLAQIQFSLSGSMYTATILSTGEVVPNISINTTSAAYGPFCNSSSNPISVAYTENGALTGTYYVQLSNAGGTFPANTTSNIIGTGTTGTFSSPISATIPAGTTAGTYRVRVINSAPVVFGTDNGSGIIINASPAAISGSGNLYCIGSSITLSDATGGGTWSSNTSSVATVGSANGIVTGASAGSATISYTLASGCYATIAESISASPATISGPSAGCVGSTATYTDATAFGAWSSSNPSIATIGSGTGVVTGEGVGTVEITYSASTTCITTKTVSIGSGANAITGPTQVCVNSTITLSDAGGGTWSSNIPSLATVGLNSGIVTGVVAGPVVITYSLSTGCTATASITVNPLPTINGSTTICPGAPTTLTGSITGGTWSSSNSSVATIGLNSGLITAGAFGSTVVTYVLPAPTGCASTASVTVSTPPGAITGPTSICNGVMPTYTDAGSGGWYSSNPSVATIGFGTGVLTSLSPGTTVITYSLGTSCNTTTTLTVNPIPAAITGASSVCPGLSANLSDTNLGGTWSSSSTSFAVIGSSTGVITGIATGSTVITYSLPTGCITETSVVVSPAPPITGNTQVCIGSTTVLSDISLGGTWSSSNTDATAGLTTGVITGVAAGTPMITYSIGTGCIATTSLTVVAALTPIVGDTDFCLGGTITLSDVTGGGSWSSNNTSIIAIDPVTGIVTSVAPGTTTVTYATSASCMTTGSVTVNPLPAAIAGADSVCFGLMSTLSDATLGGTWSSGSTAIAVIGSVSGIVTGVSSGPVNITYTLPVTGCIATLNYTVDSLPSPITGTTLLCQHATDTLSDVTTGGLWSGSNGFIATIGSVTGVVTGVSSGPAIATYTSSSGCITTVSVTIEPLPTVYSVNGGGPYCSGGTGADVYLSYSNIGINYQLYNGAVAVGTADTGINALLDFGLQTAAGTYSVIATNRTTGCVSDMNNSVPVIISPILPPHVMISTGIGHGDTVCLGAPITFTAQTINGGSRPIYTWTVNNLPVGASDSTYQYTPADYDVLAVQVNSQSACVVPDVATDTIRIFTQTPLVPSVFVQAIPATSISSGQPDTLIAIPTNCGTSPAYQWYVNGNPIAGATSNIYISNTLTNGDSVTCRVITSGPCGGVHTFNSVVITVFPTGIAAVSSGNNTIQLMPNPNNGVFTIKGSLGTAQDQEVVLSVTDMLGQVIYTGNTIAHGGNINQQVILGKSLANGMYILSVHSGSDNKVFHFVLEQ